MISAWYLLAIGLILLGIAVITGLQLPAYVAGMAFGAAAAKEGFI